MWRNDDGIIVPVKSLIDILGENFQFKIEIELRTSS